LKAAGRDFVASGVVFCLLLAPLQLLAQTSTTAEYRAKANFLANFPSFVEWPDGAFVSPQTPFLICVFGDFSFGTSLAERAHTTNFRGRRVEVVWVRKVSELSLCQILFVSRGDTKRYAKVFDAIRGRNVLTVGETPDFLDAGGAVTFSFQLEALQFEINLNAVENAHLRISSRLLALARRVVNKSSGAKT
jgi:hypothetical protein